MPCLFRILEAFWGRGDQPNYNPGVLFRCPVDIISNLTNCEIQRPGMLITQQIVEVSLVGCTNDWHNRCSWRKSILGIPPPITHVDLTVYSEIFQVCVAHQFKIKVCPNWMMCQKGLYPFENICVL